MLSSPEGVVGSCTRSVDLVQLTERGVVDDADLTVRPPVDPVTVVDRVHGLEDPDRQRGQDQGGLAVVAVSRHGRVLEVPVLGRFLHAVRLLELGLARPVDDTAARVDGVPGTAELLLLAPLGVDDRLDALRNRHQHGLLHHTVRQERLGLGLVELDGRQRSVHVNSSFPLSSGKSSVSLVDIITILSHNLCFVNYELLLTPVII